MGWINYATYIEYAIVYLRLWENTIYKIRKQVTNTSDIIPVVFLKNTRYALFVCVLGMRLQVVYFKK